jgi:hypothetical protein
MKRLEWLISIVLTISVFALVSVTASCKGKMEEKVAFESVAQKPVNFHVQEAVAECGLPLKILEMQEFGSDTKHIFFWVLLKEKPDSPKLEAVARSIIGETIAHKPETYHVFTIHFFDEAGYRGTIDKSREFAKANFLPEGSAEKIGRVLIDHYKNYKLLLKFM